MSSTPRRKVLLVEDDADQHMLVQIALSRSQRYEVAGWAVDGTEALRLAEELQPDAVLLDLYLGDSYGRDAITGLLAAAPRAMVVVLSALDPRGHRADTLALGAFAYLEKSDVYLTGRGLVPVLDELFERFDEALDGIEVCAPIRVSRLDGE